jgi:hypothetical protein
MAVLRFNVFQEIEQADYRRAGFRQDGGHYLAGSLAGV